MTTAELPVVPTNTSVGQTMLLQVKTSSVAVAVPPVPASVEETVPVVLVLVPCVVPLTLTLIEHDPPAEAIAPLVRLMLVAAAFAVNVPPQVFVAIGVASTSIPGGKLSLMAMLVAPPGLLAELVSVIVSVDVVLSRIEVGENDLATVNGAKTFNVAVAVLPVPPSVELTVPVVLGLAPAVVPLTLTLIEHEAPAEAMVPPLSDMLLALAAGLNVPPQVFVAAGVVSTTKPAGKLSVTLTPEIPAGFAAGLVMVMVSVEMPLSAMVVGENALAMVGAVKTLSVAFAVPPAPDSVELTVPVTLFFAPAVVPLTVTLIEQEPLAASEPPVKLMLVAAAAGANVPPQVLVAPGVAATSTPGGKLSVIASPLNGIAFELVKFSVSVEVPFTITLVGEKLLATVGGAATVNVAEAVKPVPPSVEDTVPVTLFFTPAVVPLTTTLIEQLPPAEAIDPPVNEMLVAIAAGLNVPPQVLVAPGVVLTSIPGGKLSLTATPVTPAGLAAGLVIVRVRVDVPLGAMVVGENAFVMVGGAKTFNVAEAVRPVPPSVELTAPVMLGLAPAVVPLTLTLMEQEPPAEAMVPPVSAMLLALATGLNVPPQVFVAAGVVSTTKPAGKVSLTATPFTAPAGFAAGLVMVIVRVDVPLSGIPDGENALVIVGGAKTFNVAFAVPPLPDSVVLTFPVTLFFAPPVVALTETLIEHDPLEVNEPPLKLMLVAAAVGAKVPPQVLVAPGAELTSTPAGKLSVIANPFNAKPFGLVKLIVRVEVPPTGILVGEKLLATVGAAATVKVAAAVKPVPPSVELTVPVTLFLGPAVVPLTTTLMEQLPPAVAIDPPVNEMLVAIAAGLNVPPQVFVAPGVVLTSIPGGKVSLTATPVTPAGLAAGLVMVMVRIDVPFGAMVVGENAFVMVGGAKTFNVAEAVKPVPPSVELTAPVMLGLAPAVVPLTLTLMEQEPPADAMVPPVSAMLLALAAGLNVPPQVFVAAGVVSTTRPAGKVSLTATPFTAPAGFAAGFVMVIVRVDMPLSGIPVGENALAIVGGAKTFKVALAVPPAPDSIELTVPVTLFLDPAVVPLTATLIEQEPLDASEPPDKLMLVAAALGANVPPQVLVAAGTAATSTPGGKLSLIASPLSAKAFGLVKLSVSVDVPFSGMLVGEKLLATVGAAATVKVAAAVNPVPPSVELTVPVVFSLEPAVVALTVTLTEQEPPAVGIEPPVKLMLVAIAAAVKVPPQVLVAPGVVLTSIPGGKASLTATPFTPAGLASGLVMMIVRVEVPPTCTPVGENDLAIVGGAKTLSVPDAVRPVPPSVEETLPVVLTIAPTCVALTTTKIVHWFETVSGPPPLRLMLVSPALGAKVPPQVLEVTTGEATSMPGGKVSAMARPLRLPGLPGGLVMAIASLAVPFSEVLFVLL